MSDQAPPQKTTHTVTIDGTPIEANPGELLIAAAERHGTYIPRFCWHPRMREVGMCRMCLVEVSGPRGMSLQPACMQPVAEGMKVDTKSAGVKKAQDGVLEFLLINHPLDCPVCDKGGECPLQDQTLTFGPGETRFVEEKRHFEKPIAISDLVFLDRERCILCDRCTRFSKDVAGDPLIHFTHRGNATEVNTFPEDPFASYFSGNTVQICPVGALTAQPYRFAARPWDLDQVESTCTSCSVGCRVVIQSSGDRITRYQGVDSDPVNWGWMCDKGRFDFEAVHAAERLTHPLARLEKGGAPEQIGWLDATTRAADALRSTAPERVGFIGGARLTNEDAYLWAEVAKGIIGTDNVDAQLGDGLPADVLFGLPGVTIDDACSASAVILLGPDLKEELPVLYLRLRDAATNRRVPIVEVSPTRTGMSTYCASSLQYRPGEVSVLVKALLSAIDGSAPAERQTAGVEADDINLAANVLAGAIAAGKGNGRIVVVLGRASLAETTDAVCEAAGLLAQRLRAVGFLPVLRRSNVRGALEMGLAPGLLPGRTSLADGRGAWSARNWKVPAGTGLDTVAMLQAAARGDLDVLVLLGADPLADVADHRLAAAAFARVPTIISIDTHPTVSNSMATLVLPAAGYAEEDGTTTNLEGRVSVLRAKVSPPGLARADWIIATEVAHALGTDLEVESVGDVTALIAKNVPLFAGVSAASLTEQVDGVLLPVASAATWRAAGDAHVPTPDAYSLRLVSSRELYDQGTIVQASASLASLARAVAAHLHPGEIERHGLRNGDQVKVSSQTSSVVMHVAENARVPRGSVWIPFNQDGVGAADLLDTDDLRDSGGVTKIRLESVGT